MSSVFPCLTVMTCHILYCRSAAGRVSRWRRCVLQVLRNAEGRAIAIPAQPSFACTHVLYNHPCAYPLCLWGCLHTGLCVSIHLQMSISVGMLTFLCISSVHGRVLKLIHMSTQISTPIAMRRCCVEQASSFGGALSMDSNNDATITNSTFADNIVVPVYEFMHALHFIIRMRARPSLRSYFTIS